MYIPSHFEVTDREEVYRFIRANSFGQLISSVEGRAFSSHLPFLLSTDGQSLVCHVAKSNPQWQSIENQEVLLTFQGPHDYISPSWYHSPGVPTWNYQAVNVYGKASLVTDSDKLASIVKELSDTHEASLETPWQAKYKESVLNIIIGIEIQITELQCKYKLSQNRPEIDQQQIIKKLKKSGSFTLAKAMKNNN
ncbi:MAG: FMN-binding negative transcriptional regulator [Methylophaga sp.]|nr:FMN-binding negative transcriptional regulator [Methylophaga sp.]